MYGNKDVMKLVFILIPGIMLSNAAFCDVASTSYVDRHTENQVQVIGDQEISGTKTYTASPVVPTPPLPE